MTDVENLFPKPDPEALFPKEPEYKGDVPVFEPKPKHPLLIEVMTEGERPPDEEAELKKAMTQTADEMEGIRAGRDLGSMALGDPYWPANAKHNEAYVAWKEYCKRNIKE
jgi:hypothetical protein